MTVAGRATAVDAWLASASDGHCGATDGLDECSTASFGSFGWRSRIKDWPTAIAWCSRACRACARCRIISVSLQFKDCSWYHACDLSRLARSPDGASGAFRSGPPLPAASDDNVSFSPAWRVVSTRKARDALRAGEDLKPAWVQPHAAMDIAVVLFGKIGTFDKPSSGVAPERGAARGTAPPAGGKQGAGGGSGRGSRGLGGLRATPSAAARAKAGAALVALASQRPDNLAAPGPRRMSSSSVSAAGEAAAATAGDGYMQQHMQQHMVREAHASFIRHVVAPNPRARYDVYCHR